VKASVRWRARRHLVAVGGRLVAVLWSEAKEQ
jgi:hypothetical protein